MNFFYYYNFYCSLYKHAYKSYINRIKMNVIRWIEKCQWLCTNVEILHNIVFGVANIVTVNVEKCFRT